MVWGALVYYVFNLSWLGLIISLSLVSISYYFINNKLDSTPQKDLIILAKPKLLSWWPTIIYLGLVIASFYNLFQNISAAALISPWSVLPKSFFLLFFIATGFLFFILNQEISLVAKKNLLRLHYLLAFSVAAIIYKIGYGFDPFIHLATMELIDKKGLVLPKPLYYLGEYSLIITFHKLSGVSIYLLNKFLVPVLAAIFLPSALLKFLATHSVSKKNVIIALIALALPFNIFILSTPQNLSYLWSLIFILYAFSGANRFLLITLGLAVLSLHPLSGLPVIFLMAYFEIAKNNKIKIFWRRLMETFLWLGTALALPLAFVVTSGGSWRQLSLSFNNLWTIFNTLKIRTNSSGFLLNYAYLLANNWVFIFIILTIFGLIIWYRKERVQALLLIKMGSALLVSFLLVSSLSFNFLISYERTDYPIRILIIIALLSVPSLLLAVDYINDKVWQSNKIILVSGWLLISIILTCSLYLSYPRLDAYHNSRGYSVSASDVIAVNFIENQTNEKYIVLANQQTSVAALAELGFDNYLTTPAGELFFYPIPTGGELYQYYLQMVNQKPDQSIMTSAMQLAGVKESYFVVNKYWTFSNRLIAEAKLQATEFWSIDNGNIYIFKYTY